MNPSTPSHKGWKTRPRYRYWTTGNGIWKGELVEDTVSADKYRELLIKYHTANLENIIFF